MFKLIENLKQNKFLSEFLTYKAIVQFRKYLIVGFSAFALEYLSYLILLSYTSLNVSHATSMTLGFILSFALNRLWAFKSKEKFTKQFVYMIVLFIINLRISIFFIDQLTGALKIHAFIAKLIVMGFIILWNFVIYKKLIYRR